MARSHRTPWPLRRHLGLLLAGTLLPVLLFAAGVVVRLSSERRAAIENRLLVSAREMSATLDHEWGVTIQALQVLAQSPRLASGDLEAFRSEASVALTMHPSWMTIILLAPDGQQLLNLRAAPGGVMRSPNDGPSFERVLAEQGPVVGALRKSRGGSHWGFPIRVPVVREGRVHYVLTAVIPTGSVAELMADFATVGDELTRTLVDGEGTVVFSGRSPERFIGTSATASFLSAVEGREEGIFRSVTMEGLESYVAFRRSRAYGWVSAVVVPREFFEGPLRRSLWALGAVGAGALLISALGAVLLSTRFRRGMQELESAGRLLAEGQFRSPERSGIRELDLLADSLGASATLLQERGRERDDHLARAEAAVRTRDEFLSLASHELKTPLTSLVLHARILQGALDQDARSLRGAGQRFVDQAVKQTARLGKLINDMLDISRINAGRMSLEPEPFDLVELVEETVARLTPMLTEAGCTVALSLSGPVRGRWDRFRLDQVLSNLLTNAGRYGPGAPVEVAVRRDGDHAVLTVRDHGPGIAPEDLERVFDKFERAVAPGAVPGLGLGLYIVREIIHMHGGTVRARSAPGQGATLVATLPLGTVTTDRDQRTA